MSKLVRTLVVTLAVIIQVILSVLYGFSNLQMSASVCFVIWVLCTMMICRMLEAPKTV